MDSKNRSVLLGMTCFTLPTRGLSINNIPLYCLKEYQECMEKMLSEIHGVIIATPEFAEQIRFDNPIIILSTKESTVPIPKGTICTTNSVAQALEFAKSKYTHIWAFGGKEIHTALFRDYDFIIAMELHEGDSVRKPTECFPDFVNLFDLKGVLASGFNRERNIRYKVKRYEKIA